jgi:nickel-dependent lactate racemase
MNLERIELPLGDSSLTFSLAPEVSWDIWRAQESESEAGVALPQLESPLRLELENTRDRWQSATEPVEAAIVVPDLTRPVPMRELLTPLLASLQAVGVGRERCRLVVAAGTHKRPMAETLWEAWGSGEDLKLAIHDADAPGVALGNTPEGTPVELDPAYVHAALRLTVGAVSFHYFAGFGGGPKLVFPGVAARSCVKANHRRALAPLPPGGLSPGCAPGAIEGNPVAADIAAAASKCPAHVGVHLLRSQSGWRAFVGSKGLEQARAVLLQRGSRGRAADYDVVVASAGGAPHDVDLVQAHKALVHASGYCRDGGAIILAAATPRGPGSDSFAEWLEISDLQQLEVRAREHYELNAQTAISFRRRVQRFDVTWLGSETPEWIRRTGAHVAASPAEAWEVAKRGARSSGKLARGAVLPQATAVIPGAVGERGGGTDD